MTISPAEAWLLPPPIALLANVEMAIPRASQAAG